MANFEDVYNFEPNSEEEKIFFEIHRELSITISELIRSIPKEKRLLALRVSAPTDTNLMAVYLWALKKEDYETCEATKALLIERGFKNIPS